MFTEKRLRRGLVDQFGNASPSGVDEPVADLVVRVSRTLSP